METNLKYFLGQVLTILNTDPAQQEKMLIELEQLIQLSAATHLISTLPEGDRQKLNSQLANQPQETHAQYIAEFLTRKFNRDQYLTAINQAVHEVIPEYVATLAQNATPEARDKINQLLQ